MTQSMRFDARTLSAAWLSVAIASGDDPNRPSLCDSVHVEWFGEGVRLVATDGVMLLTAWAPSDFDSDAAAPRSDEVPVERVTVIDEDRRAASLFSHLWKLATAKDALPFTVELREGPSASAEGALAGMEARSVVIDHPDHERVELRVFDGAYPEWRHLLNGEKPKATSAVSLAPKILGRLSKLGRWHGGPLHCEMYGTKAIRVAMLGSVPEVEGAVMPVKVR